MGKVQAKLDDDKEDDKDEDDDDDDIIHDYKYYDNIGAGCMAFGQQAEESYYDLHVPSPFRSSSSNKIRFQKEIEKIVKRRGIRGRRWWQWRRLRILFPSEISSKDVVDVLEYMIDQEFFDYDNKSRGIYHLAFGVREVVYDYDYDTAPICIPIKTFGEVLKRVSSSSPSSSSSSSSSLKSLSLGHLRFVGTTQKEFVDAFENQLSRCASIREFIFDSCLFQVQQVQPPRSSYSTRAATRAATRATTATTTTATATSGNIFNSMFKALNELDSLEVISISHAELHHLSDHDNAFTDIILKKKHHRNIRRRKRDRRPRQQKQMEKQQQQQQQQRKNLKVVSLEECTISNHMLETMFGENSRIEKLSLADTITSKSQISNIADLLRTKNRTLRYLNLYSGKESLIEIPETIDLLKALEVNDTLKSLHLAVDCNGGESLCDLTPVFIDRLKRLAGLQKLDLHFRGLGLDTDAAAEKSLECISSIVRHGLGGKKTLKNVDFILGAFYHRYSNHDKAKKDDLRKTFTNDINTSLVRALKSSPPSSLSSLQKKKKKKKKKKGGCTLEHFYLYVDGTFTVEPDKEAQFWLSLNEKNMRQKLNLHPDDFKLWRDAIIEHNSNPEITYHLLRQNYALLIADSTCI